MNGASSEVASSPLISRVGRETNIAGRIEAWQSLVGASRNKIKSETILPRPPLQEPPDFSKTVAGLQRQYIFSSRDVLLAHRGPTIFQIACGVQPMTRPIAVPPVPSARIW
jgi:hypothetical protein